MILVLGMIVKEPCWTTFNKPKNDGYVQVKTEGRLQYLHRLVYEALVGPIPEGMFLDHLCRQRDCCNPDHLEPVTNKENCRRGNCGIRGRNTTHCPEGHEYGGSNVYQWGGMRFCRKCRNEAQRRYEARKRMAV